MLCVNARVFLNTIGNCKATLDDLCEVAKREMKEKSDRDLGSWKLLFSDWSQFSTQAYKPRNYNGRGKLSVIRKTMEKETTKVYVSVH